MQYKHISKEERRKIDKLTQTGSSNKKIAEELGWLASTIVRELKRNYEHERAQKLVDKRRKNSKGPKIGEKTWKKVFGLFKMELQSETDSESCKGELRKHLSQDLCGNPSVSICLIRELLKKNFP